MWCSYVSHLVAISLEECGVEILILCHISFYGWPTQEELEHFLFKNAFAVLSGKQPHWQGPLQGLFALRPLPGSHGPEDP